MLRQLLFSELDVPLFSHACVLSRSLVRNLRTTMFWFWNLDSQRDLASILAVRLLWQALDLSSVSVDCAFYDRFPRDSGNKTVALFEGRGADLVTCGTEQSKKKPLHNGDDPGQFLDSSLGHLASKTLKYLSFLYRLPLEK